jgi:hypothetical protein
MFGSDQWKKDAELRARTGTITRRFDLAAVIDNDPVADRQPQASPLAIAASCKERFKKVFQYFAVHAAPVIADDQSRLSAIQSQLDGNRAIFVETVERIRQEIEQDLFDFLRVHAGNNALATLKLDLFVLIAADMPDHLDDIVGQLAQIGVLMVDVADT